MYLAYHLRPLQRWIKRIDMDQQNKTFLLNKVKPSLTVLIIVLVILSISLYLMVKPMLHRKSTIYSSQKLELPEEVISQPTSDQPAKNSGWTVVRTHQGDTLAGLFKRVGLSGQTLYAVLNNNEHAKLLTNIKLDQEIQFLIQNKQLIKLIFPISFTQYLIVTQDGKNYRSTLHSKKMDSRNEYLTATVYGSLYSTAKRENLPFKLIKQMTDIFNWEIDFIKDIRSGDQISILYEAFYIEDKLVSTGDILAVMYTNRGIKHQAIRHISASGDHDYFTPQGVSLKKAFSRYPIHFSHISSTYSLSRYHPILHYRRAHKGVDLAASIGTPIHATGDGRVQIIQRHSGYGNMIKIVHDKTYSSLYAHLLKFQKGLAKGDRVKRGQVIGYVGQTGLADGPHCHYEVHVNNQPKNPTTIPLPRSMPVSGREISSFKGKANSLLSQLELYQEANLAVAHKKLAKNMD